MKRLILPFITILFWLNGCVSPKPELVFENQLAETPAQDPTYTTRLKKLEDAIRSGRTVTVYMKHFDGNNNFDGQEYSAVFVATRMDSTKVVGLLPLRHYLNSDGTIYRADGFWGGSVDTLGNYMYSAYHWYTNIVDQSTGAKTADLTGYEIISPTIDNRYVIKWYAK